MKKNKKHIDTDELIDGLLASMSEKERRVIDYRMGLAAKISAAIKAKGWNKSKFSEEMQVQNSVVTRWLSGTHNFESDTLIEIESKLGINLLNLDFNDTTEVKQIKAAPTSDLQFIDYEGGRVVDMNWHKEEKFILHAANGE